MPYLSNLVIFEEFIKKPGISVFKTYKEFVIVHGGGHQLSAGEHIKTL